MKLTVYPGFWQQGNDLLTMNSLCGFVIGEISGSQTKDGIVLEEIHLPNRSKTLSVKSYEELISNRGRNGYEAISAPHSCLLTEKYEKRMRGKSVIGYAGRCPILQPTINDLRYANRFLSMETDNVMMAFFHERLGCAIYAVSGHDLEAIFSQDVIDFPQEVIAKFAERRLVYKSRTIPHQINKQRQLSTALSA